MCAEATPSYPCDQPPVPAVAAPVVLRTTRHWQDIHSSCNSSTAVWVSAKYLQSCGKKQHDTNLHGNRTAYWQVNDARHATVSSTHDIPSGETDCPVSTFLDSILQARAAEGSRYGTERQ